MKYFVVNKDSEQIVAEVSTEELAMKCAALYNYRCHYRDYRVRKVMEEADVLKALEGMPADWDWKKY